MAKIQIKRGLQEGVESLVLSEGEPAVALDTGNLYIGTPSGTVHVNPKGGTAASADKLATAQNFSITGDATAPAVSFDGTAPVALSLQITSLPSSKISGLGTAAAADLGTAAGNVVTVQSTGTILPSLIPDLSSTYLSASQKGSANGVATLGSDGKVPSSQLPSYVDDVREYDSLDTFPETGDTDVIYIAEDTNKTYRWSGSGYVEISASLALGTTSSTAFRGDLGQIAYDHSQTTGNPHNTTAAQVGAAPSSHTTVVASFSQLGHIKVGSGLQIAGDGLLSLGDIDGGTF